MPKLGRIVACLLVVGVNAAPGIFFAWRDFDRAGILLGVAFWLGVYVWVGHSGPGDRLLQRGYVRYAIVTGVMLRFVPYCWIPDVFCGFLRMRVFGFSDFPLGATASPISPGYRFLATLGTTVVHGLLMGLLFWGTVALLSYLYSLGWKSDTPTGICTKCGYDLRASPVRCPECGTPNPNPERATLANP